MAGIATIKLRRGTAAAWTAANPVLALGEPGLESDTRKIKFGDGTTAWNSLLYVLDGADWTLAVNESGASFSNFTAVNGSWSSDGTNINNNTGATYTRAYYKNALPLGLPYIAECEFFATSLTGTAIFMSILFNYTGSGSGSPVGELVATSTTPSSTGLARIELDTVSARLSVASPWVISTWYKLRVVCNGLNASLYLNGTLIGTAGNLNTTVSNVANYIGIGCAGGNFSFRNFKVWLLGSGSFPA